RLANNQQKHHFGWTSMSTASAYSEKLQKAMVNPTGGVVGLVHELLSVCGEHALEVDWRGAILRVRAQKGDWEDLIDTALRQSIKRAILSRVAVLCNERNPNSMSSYGGESVLRLTPSSPKSFRVVIVNTTEEQVLHLIPEVESNSESLGTRGVGFSENAKNIPSARTDAVSPISHS
ncbi:MAG: hypothetical protein ACRD36_05100, partial [Candidatus Acidiferrum sp.]